MDSKAFLESVKPRTEGGARQSIYVTKGEWEKFQKHCGHLRASLVLEHFIRLFNKGMEKKD